MAKKYCAYFNSLQGIKYKVELIGQGASGDSTEVLLAGNDPFILDYDNSETPFEPLRGAVASINFVHNEYFEDILSPYAQGTAVSLYDITSGDTNTNLVWTGYLQPKLYDQSYVNCYETVQLAANDCIKVLQYMDYENKSGFADIRQFTTFKEILMQICNKTNLNGFYWGTNKSLSGYTLNPNQLVISEQNFYYNDTEEPIKLNEVLEMICQYLGFTAIQWKDELFLVDYENMDSQDRFQVIHYEKSQNYNPSNPMYLDSPYTVSNSGDTIMGANHSISFTPIYNKITVRDNFYTADEFLPNIFDDDNLVNRVSAGTETEDDYFYYAFEFKAPERTGFDAPKPLYPCGSKAFGTKNKYAEDAEKDTLSEKSGDTAYRYFHRLFYNKYWETSYRGSAPACSTGTTTACAGGTIMDLGCVEKDRTEFYQDIIPNKMDFTRYLCICEKGEGGWVTSTGKKILELKSGFTSTFMATPISWLVINFKALMERYENRAYINPDWNNDHLVGRSTGGGFGNTTARFSFKLKIGDKYWDGEHWTTSDSIFYIPTKFLHGPNEIKKGLNVDMSMPEYADDWNRDLSVLNNVSWRDNINAEGYKIPLADIDTTQEVKFEMYIPTNQFQYHDDDGNLDMSYNAYAWVSDFNISVVEENNMKKENDVVYQNEIDVDAVNEMSEIVFKMTTWAPLGQPAYSNVIYYNGENHLFQEYTQDNITKKPEEHCVAKYYDQYSTPTKKITLNHNLDINPFQKVYDVYVADPNEQYVVVGQNIDFQFDRQEITMINKK